jgi:transposase
MDDPKFRSQTEVLSVVDKGRRRDWTDAEKVRIIEESLRGYRQCAATARRYEISRALLTRWRREFRSGHLVADGRPRFMAVQIAPDAANSAARQPPESPSSSNNDRIEITLANGRKIAVGTTIDPMVLGRLVQVLDRA